MCIESKYCAQKIIDSLEKVNSWLDEQKLFSNDSFKDREERVNLNLFYNLLIYNLGL